MTTHYCTILQEGITNCGHMECMYFARMTHQPSEKIIKIPVKYHGTRHNIQYHVRGTVKA